MLLWNIIRDWFVQYVFGGTLSTGAFVNGAILGSYYGLGNDEVYLGDTTHIFTNESFIPLNGGGFHNYTPFQYIDIADQTAYEVVGNVGDWLSSTATIITLVALCLFLFLAVKWVFNVFRNTLERVGK